MKRASKLCFVLIVTLGVFFETEFLPAQPTSEAKAASAQPLPTGLGRVLSVDRAYYAMVSGALEKWDFHQDGTFLHEGVAAGAGTNVRTSGRGTYRIYGSTLVLHMGNKATAFVTPESRSGSWGGGTDSNAKAIQVKIRLLGPDGANGVVINGTTFHVRHGW